MAAPAFRSSANQQAVASSFTVTEPAGAASGDIFIGIAYIEANTTFTTPTGWTDLFTASSTALDSGSMTTPDTWESKAFWIRRGGSAPSLTFTVGASAYGEARVMAFSGAYSSGDPFSFVSKAVRNTSVLNSPFPDVSGTTDTADELLIWIGTNYTGATTWQKPTSPGTWTDRGTNFTDVYLADQSQAAAGATGTVTGAASNNGASSNAVSFLFGLRSLAAPGAYVAPTIVVPRYAPQRAASW